MIASKMLSKVAVGLGVLVAPLAIAVANGASASADPGLCVSGPFGYAYACVQAPGWVDYWYDGPHWRGNGHGHGHGHDWDDD